MDLSLIAAVAQNGVIGTNNRLPWHLPADLQHFKSVTLSKPVIMGRKTFESIGRPLPGRSNIVLSRDAAWTMPGVVVAGNVDAALRLCAGAPEVMVIGGAEVYRLLLPRASTVYLTEIHAHFDGDAVFPGLQSWQWEVAERREFVAAGDQPGYAFVTLRRIAGP